ncbi:MAG: outer membrane beta-barrel protein [Sulfurovum sp.]|nr:outer membrane beta-barrel protein [Sulfurovum sp.]
MKKLTLSLATVLTLTSGAFASSVNENTSDWMEPAGYVGIGYTRISGDIDVSVFGFGSESASISGNAVTLNAGFNFNPYIAVEARYTRAIDETSLDTDFGTLYSNDRISNFGAYVKPQYKTGTGTLYALLGYGRVDVENTGENEFQWGIGASYEYESNFSIFFDYMRISDSSETLYTPYGAVSVNTTLDTYTFGLSYRF